MKKARIFFNNIPAGILTEQNNGHFIFEYLENYQGPAIFLTMPTSQRNCQFNEFPAAFDNLLPEGQRLEALLRQAKLNRHDYLSQLIAVGNDMIGAITIEQYL